MLPIYPRVWADPIYRSDTEKLFSKLTFGFNSILLTLILPFEFFPKYATALSSYLITGHFIFAAKAKNVII